ncbi:MAG: hypothetical protein ABSG68_05285 [Thermoguttaceae bacterium]|jgi:hypothetical protein
MKRRTVVGLVLGVNLLAAAGLEAIVVRELAGRYRPIIQDALVAAVALAQGTLLAVWAALSGKRTAWRFGGAVVLAACATLLLQRAYSFRPQEWGYFVTAQLIGTSIPLMLLRLLGLGMSVAPVGAQLPAEAPDRRAFRVQFSLRALLEWTTALAVLCSMIRIMPEEFRHAFVSPDGAWLAGLFGLAGGLAASVLWVALGTRWLAARLIVAVCATAVVGLYGLYGRVGPHGSTWLVLTAAYVIWTLISLYPFRLLGYRLAWQQECPGSHG